jgi:DNA-binding MarR family transcriptional regulator
MVDNFNPFASLLFSEIASVEQLFRMRASKLLPKGMEFSHFLLLIHLTNSNGERQPSQLAEVFHLTRGAVTNTLAKLETVGHIHIRPDWDDGRRKHVSISQSGRAACEQALRAISPLIDKAVSTIGEEQIKALLPALRELREVLASDV